MKRRDEQSKSFPPNEHLPDGPSEQRPETRTNTNAAEDESRLLEASLCGNIDAFGDLFERYRPALYARCLKHLGDSSLAEDIVQEVFLRGFMNLPSFDPSKPIWPWLATIASRMCIGTARSRSYTQYLEDIGTAADADVNRVVADRRAEMPLDVVIASETFADLWQSLNVLPKRQRRVFLLYALDGWSCAEIAAAEGVSVGAVHLLLFRARRKMRATRQRDLPALVLVPHAWLRSKLQSASRRVAMLSPSGDSLNLLSGAGALVISLTISVLIATSARNSEPSDGMGTKRFDEAETHVQSQAVINRLSVAPSTNVTEDSPQPAQGVPTAPGSLVNGVVHPYEGATPENTYPGYVTVSPNYQNDHIVLTSGSVWGSAFVFISQDGGASWRSLPSRLLMGSTSWMFPLLAVPSPGYSHDQRIFVIGEAGLQQSDDGGGVFRTVSPKLSPLTRGLALSPQFERGDSRILIGDETLLEYNAGTGVTQPASLGIPPSRGAGYSSVHFSPGYPVDPTILVSDNSDGKTIWWTASDERAILYRCEGSVCIEKWFPFPGPLHLRLSPRFHEDGLAYAFTFTKLLVSHDGARTFQDVTFSLPTDRLIKDVAVLWGESSVSSDPAIFVSTNNGHYSEFLYRSYDAGRSWSRSRIDAHPGFEYSARALTATPTGRLFAAGLWGGIACSEDGAITWAPRCTPEP